MNPTILAQSTPIPKPLFLRLFSPRPLWLGIAGDNYRVLSSDHACIIHGLCHSNNVSYVHAQAMTRYSQGRAFEYERIRFWREQGQYCMRSAGSKGAYDYLHLTPAGTVVLVQCKKVQTEAQAKKMITLFEANPPLPRGNFCQALEVLVIRKGLFFGWVDEAEDRPPVIEVDAAGVPTNW